MFNRRLEQYQRPKKCKACGYERFYWDTERNRRPWIERPDETCKCDGYTHPHRPGAKFCVKNPNHEFNTRVHWMGESPSIVRADMAFEGRGGIQSDEPPF